MPGSTDLIKPLRQRARDLHRRARRAHPSALEALRVVPGLKSIDTAALPTEVRRKHCLALIATTLGFRGWPHAKAVLTGNADEDLGTLMHVDTCGAHWNVWSAHYSEAKAIRAEHGGYLLPYKSQFFIAEAHYIRELGLNPQDADWEHIGRDWVRPADRNAWSRLTASVIDNRLSA